MKLGDGDPGGWEVLTPVKICKRGQRMFWPLPKNVTFFRSKLLLDNYASFTLSKKKVLYQNWKVKLIFRGTWNSLMSWPDGPDLFYDTSAPLCATI